MRWRPSAFERGAQLRRARDSARGGERLGDVVGGEVHAGRGGTRAPRRCAPRAPASCWRGRRPGATATGRTCTNATSISSTWSSTHQDVRGLDVAVRDPGVPELADDLQALVDHLVVDRRVADLLRVVEELGDEQVLALRASARRCRTTSRSGCRRRGAGAPRSPRTRRVGAPIGTSSRPPAARRGSCVRACTNGPSARGSSRRAWRTGSTPPLRGRRPSSGSGSIRPSPRGRCDRPRAPRCRAGPAPPGWIASPRRPPTSRCAVFPRLYATGKTEFGVKKRNARSGIATPSVTADDDVRRVVAREVEARADEAPRRAPR